MKIVDITDQRIFYIMKDNLIELDNFENDLTEWFSNFKKIVIVGIGNPLRRDDGVGIEIVRKLVRKISKDVLLIESENVPENFIEPIVKFKPSHILIIDAALLGLGSGSIKLTNFFEVSGVAISTHVLPIQILCSYLKKVTNSKIGLLLIQPENVDFGEGLSPELVRTVDRAVNVLLKILP